MKLHHYLLIAPVAAALAVAGSHAKAQQSSMQPAAPQEMQPMPPRVAAQTPAPTPVLNRDEFTADAGKKLKDLDTKIDELVKKSSELKDDAKAEADKGIAELSKARAALGKKYDDLKTSSQDSWDKARTAFTAAWEDIQKTYTDVKSKL